MFYYHIYAGQETSFDLYVKLWKSSAVWQFAYNMLCVCAVKQSNCFLVCVIKYVSIAGNCKKQAGDFFQRIFSSVCHHASQRERIKERTSADLECDQSSYSEKRGVIIGGIQQTVLSADSHTLIKRSTQLCFNNKWPSGRQAPPAERPSHSRLG